MVTKAASGTLKSVLINAISVKEGGSAVVLNRLLDDMSALAPTIEWHVIVDQRLLDSLPKGPLIHGHAFPWISHSPLHLKYWYEFELPRLIKKLRPDVFYSQTNYLPYRRLECPSLLLVQHAGHFSDAFGELMLAASSPLGKLAWHAKRRWVHASLARATKITVQTQALADAIVKLTHVPPDRLKIIPHGPGLIANALPPKTFPGRPDWRIGFISKFGVQKNFATLLRATHRVRAAGRSIKLVLTLPDGGAASAFGTLQPLIDELDLGSAIENAGDLSASGVQALYAGLDAFVFPSICESFGFPMVEAMACGLPLIVADNPTNQEVTGGAALTFSAFDDAALAGQLNMIMSDRLTYDALAVRSVERARHFSWQETARLTLETLNLISTGQRRHE